MSIPLVEKYRPSRLADIVDQDNTIQTLSRSLASKNLPHLLFYGPPGTGKTSTIQALAKELYGDKYKQRVLELNASDERGIDVVRTKIKDFAKTSLQNGFKLIILDEADSMTSDAQSALRRTIETFSKTTRFCLICNYVTRIIDPLASRCAKFRFRKLGNAKIQSHLMNIAQGENMLLNDDVIETVVQVCDGDMRQAITLLQSLKNSGLKSVEDVYEMNGIIPMNLIQDLFKAWESKDTFKIKSALHQIFQSGYDGIQLLHQIQQYVLSGSFVGPKTWAVALGKVEKHIFDGADQEIQIFGMLLAAA